MHQTAAPIRPPRRSGVRATVRGLALACHPVPTAGVTTVSLLLAAGVGLSAGRVVLLGAAVLTGQLSIGWSNDRIDAGRDAATARTDKPAAVGAVPLPVLGGAAATGLALTVVLSLLLGLPAAAALLTLVAAGWAYNLGLKSTQLSAVTYLVGFAALPAAPYLAKAGHPSPPWWVPVAGALLGLAAHVANVLPDLRADAATGVRGLPHRLGATGSTVLLAASLAAAAVVLAVGPSRPSGVAVTAVVVGSVASTAVLVLALRRPDSPAAFRVTVVLALLDVVLAVALR